MSVGYIASFLRIGPKVPGVLYEPVSPGDKRSVAIVAIHCEADYLDHTIGPGLAERGYTVLCGKTHDAGESLAVKIQDVSYAVALLRKRPGIHKIILMGHSGGASLMSAYQNIAENGVKTFQGPEKVIPCPDFLEGIPAADGFLCLDSNWGNGTMTLFGTDPAVVDERF